MKASAPITVTIPKYWDSLGCTKELVDDDPVSYPTDSGSYFVEWIVKDRIVVQDQFKQNLGDEWTDYAITLSQRLSGDYLGLQQRVDGGAWTGVANIESGDPTMLIGNATDSIVRYQTVGMPAEEAEKYLDGRYCITPFNNSVTLEYQCVLRAMNQNIPIPLLLKNQRVWGIRAGRVSTLHCNDNKVK